jgi:tRNA pseudouridine13 synthase
MPDSFMKPVESTEAQDIIGLDKLSFAYGQPAISAKLKQEYQDFLVDEQLGFEFSGQGEHLCVQVEKIDHSTVDVAKKLSEVSGVGRSAIGYAGMKDRRARTRQWFSLKLPSESEARLEAFESTSLHIVESIRNSRKIKIGSHKSNHFTIRLRDCRGTKSEFEERLKNIQSHGVPNYFGAQRFGRDMSNLSQVQALMESVPGTQQELGTRVGEPAFPQQRFKRSMLFSAARSYLFNQILSSRLKQDSWNQYLAGDVLNLDGTDRVFVLKSESEWDSLLQQRLDTFDIHITGLLPGLVDTKDKYISSGKAADIENAVCEQFDSLLQGLRHFGLQSARRALRFRPIDLNWQWLPSEAEAGGSGHDLLLDFSLVKGAYATSLLRELCVSTESGNT